MSQVYLLAAVDQVMMCKVNSSCELKSAVAQRMNILNLGYFQLLHVVGSASSEFGMVDVES